jgi:hypothetical protein
VAHTVNEYLNVAYNDTLLNNETGFFTLTYSSFLAVSEYRIQQGFDRGAVLNSFPSGRNAMRGNNDGVIFAVNNLLPSLD